MASELEASAAAQRTFRELVASAFLALPNWAVPSAAQPFPLSNLRLDMMDIKGLNSSQMRLEPIWLQLAMRLQFNAVRQRCRHLAALPLAERITRHGNAVSLGGTAARQ